MTGHTADALVIGGGFYGAEVALELRRLGFERVVVAEREPGILRRASYVNQARVHHGYHYPRSLATAERSRASFETFLDEYGHAVHFGMQSVYAIARASRVSAAQFEAFCRTIDAPCHAAPRRIAALFEPGLIERAFLTRELSFDAVRLAEGLGCQLARAGVELRLGAEAQVTGADAGGVDVCVGGTVERAAYVFNCTYADIEFVGVPLGTRVKKELAEIVLVEPPGDLANVGVTVMDGPFFSTTPFPAEGLHSLTHVRYTPHEASTASHREPLAPARSHRDAMLRDAQRYLPCLGRARVVRSLFEIKAVLLRNEDDDGRPILIERSPMSPRIHSVLGAKIDNIYDVRSYLRAQHWS